VIENIITLLFISIIVSTAEKDRAIGYLIIAYYSVYILIELSEFGVTFGNVFTTYKEFESWYLLCCILSIAFSVVATIICRYKGGVACLYALILIIDALFCGVMAVSQSFETNYLLNVYNTLQNISLFVDLSVVMLGTDHLIKRKFRGASNVIDTINTRIERWCYMVFNTSDKG
jgi:hypothetical protein